MHNHYYWVHWSRDVFRKEIAVLYEVIAKRLLPSFDSIDDEADAVSDETWERLGAVSHPDTDAGMDAEAAENAGLRHYEAMVNAKQALQNLFAVALHHLIEQQQMTVLRQELLLRDKDITEQTLKVTEFVKRLSDAGIGVETFAAWPTIKELREVANAVKHADGRSANWLRDNHSEIFIPPCVRGTAQSSIPNPIRWPFQPLSGQDLYVATDDLDRYFRAAEGFWREFEQALASKAQT